MTWCPIEPFPGTVVPTTPTVTPRPLRRRSRNVKPPGVRRGGCAAIGISGRAPGRATKWPASGDA
jgi:hypothetical protein